MQSCEPSGRKQQKIAVRKLLLGMERLRNERRRGGREEKGVINEVIVSHSPSTGPWSGLLSMWQLHEETNEAIMTSGRNWQQDPHGEE